MAKTRITRTYGPIHFEDLDPHRFEDMVRELIYDFRDWQSIEATGRSGNDDGFDARAIEKSFTPQSDDPDSQLTEISDGKQWMIQGKREKEIGPKKLKSILADIDSKAPPYGYILAASVNFSKASYDLFRSELRNKGVMEFYLWGKSELEDMLHMPKNDRILFTFFGISLTTKRKSLTTEARSAVTVKNKLFGMFGESYNFYQSVLLRDIKDTNYPYEFQCTNFKAQPTWKEYIGYEHHPLGLMCHNHKYFAYVNEEKKEYDYIATSDLVNRQHRSEKDENFEHEKLIRECWEFMPREFQGYFTIDCIVKYDDILLIDEKGDFNYKMPHIYVDYSNELGPFAGCLTFVELNSQQYSPEEDGYKRVEYFPKEIRKIRNGKIYKNKSIQLNQTASEEFRNYKVESIYCLDDKYDFLKPRDIIKLEYENGGQKEDQFIQITHKFLTSKSKLVKKSKEPYKLEQSIKVQLGEIGDNQKINVFEFKRTYLNQFETPPKKT